MSFIFLLTFRPLPSEVTAAVAPVHLFISSALIINYGYHTTRVTVLMLLVKFGPCLCVAVTCKSDSAFV
jgi:hypothetical protein